MSLKPGWKEKFIKSLSAKGNVTVAARAAGVARAYAYEAREEDKDFAKAWDEALEEAIDTIEEEARRRACDGTLKPVFQGGEQVGSVREYSDTLMVLLLKAHRPKKYRENSRVEHTGADGKPIEHVVVNYDDLTPEELVRLHQEKIGDPRQDR